MAVTMAIVTSTAWKTAPAHLLPEPQAARLRTLAPLTTGLIYVQILLGAVVRHTGAGLSIPDFPTCFGGLYPTVDTWSFAVLIHFAHRVGACVVALAIIALAATVLLRHRTARPVLVPVLALCGLVVVQVLLGGSIIWTGRMVVATVAHVACGALILVTSLVATLWTYRLGTPGWGAETA
jgi:cytochrome c oxidase assembly protein subunit 15